MKDYFTNNGKTAAENYAAYLADREEESRESQQEFEARKKELWTPPEQVVATAHFNGENGTEVETAVFAPTAALGEVMVWGKTVRSDHWGIRSETPVRLTLTPDFKGRFGNPYDDRPKVERRPEPKSPPQPEPAEDTSDA